MYYHRWQSIFVLFSPLSHASVAVSPFFPSPPPPPPPLLSCVSPIPFLSRLPRILDLSHTRSKGNEQIKAAPAGASIRRPYSRYFGMWPQGNVCTYIYIYMYVSCTFQARPTDLQMEKTRSGIILSSEWLGIMKPIGRPATSLFSRTIRNRSSRLAGKLFRFDHSFGRFLFLNRFST